MKRYIEPAGGLANRVRVILTALEKFGDDTIVFIWRKNKDCPCQWRDLFESPKILTITSPMPGEKHERTCSVFLELHPRMYRNLAPSKPIMDEVLRFCEGATFDAIHVRRTDHVAVAKKNNRFTTDEEFFEFADKSERFFLACDNPETVAMFKERYGTKCLTREIKWTNDHRKTTVQDALIDLMICTKAQQFKGSGWSSFSDMIKLIRKSPE